MNIYVGNLPYTTSDADLEELFSQYGAVVSAKVVKDNHSGRSKGFGFVELESKEAGEQAIENLNGTEMDGRSIVVNEARPKAPREGGFGGGGDRGGFGGGGGDRGRGGPRGGGDRGGRGGGGGDRGGRGGGDRGGNRGGGGRY